MSVVLESIKSTSDVCPCCDTISSISCGHIAQDENGICDYVVRWTDGDFEHPVGIFIVSLCHDKRVGMTIEYRFNEDGFMIVDNDRFDWPKDLRDKANWFFERNDLIENDDEKWVYNILDVIWAQDANIPRKDA